MTNPVTQPSLASGEIGPKLFGRVDMTKYRTGVAYARNWFVDYRGGMSTRPGFKFEGFCLHADRRARLIPFQFNSDDSLFLEFNHLAIRFIGEGGYVTEAPKNVFNINRASPGVVTVTAHGFTTGDTVYITGLNGMPELNNRTFLAVVLTANTFSLTDFFGSAIDTTNYTPWVSGGTVARVYTLTSPYTEDEIPDLKFAQSADIVTLFHPDHPPTELTRFAATNWTLTPITFEATLPAPSGVTLSTTAAGGYYFGYKITAVSADEDESLPATGGQIASVNIAATAGTITINWTAVTDAAYYRVYKASQTASVEISPAAPFGFAGYAYGPEFKDSNIIPDFSVQPPKHLNPFAPRAVTGISIISGGAGYQNPFPVFGSGFTITVTISDPTGTGAEVAPVIVGGVIVSFIVINGGENYTAPTISVVASAGAGFSGTVETGPATGVYPSCGCYFQQKLVLGATTLKPASMWFSRPGAFKNFDYSIPTTDGDSFSITLASTQVNTIRSLVPMPGGLVAFTAGGVWQISGGGQGGPVTALTVQATPQTFTGANNLPPIPLGYNLVYCQELGPVIRALRYNLFANIYEGVDLNISSNHMLEGYTLEEWAYAAEPYKIIWSVRSDGALIAHTFHPEQEVNGWAVQTTDGFFESIASRTLGSEVIVAAIVRRKLHGQWVRCVERLAPRTFPYGVESAFAVDCGLSLAHNYPAGTLERDTLRFISSVSVFSSSSVGWIIRVAGGIYEITEYETPTIVRARELRPADNADLAEAGDWSLDEPVTEISGLEHLEGRQVVALADGSYIAPQTVVGGKITLPGPATEVHVGLPYTCPLKSLPLVIDGSEVIGKRKKIPAVTSRVTQTRSLRIGPDFDTLTFVKERDLEEMGRPVELITDDIRTEIDSGWDMRGQVCFEQSYPLPATILTITPEVQVGDN